MRKILFRGREINTGKWAYGNYYYEAKNQNTPYYITWNGKDALGDFGDRYHPVNNVIVEPETIGQYTGLKDKNGTKIFEGDIVIGDIPELLGNQNLIGVVEYEESAFIIRIPNRKSWQIQKVGFCSFINYKVIGNIFDNPRLLEEKKNVKN